MLAPKMMVAAKTIVVASLIADPRPATSLSMVLLPRRRRSRPLATRKAEMAIARVATVGDAVVTVKTAEVAVVAARTLVAVPPTTLLKAMALCVSLTPTARARAVGEVATVVETAVATEVVTEVAMAATVMVATVMEATVMEATAHMEATVMEAIVMEAIVMEATVMEATVMEATVMEAMATAITPVVLVVVAVATVAETVVVTVAETVMVTVAETVMVIVAATVAATMLMPPLPVDSSELRLEQRVSWNEDNNSAAGEVCKILLSAHTD